MGQLILSINFVLGRAGREVSVNKSKKLNSFFYFPFLESSNRQRPENKQDDE